MNQSLLGQLEDLLADARKCANESGDEGFDATAGFDDLMTGLGRAIETVRQIDKHHTDLGALLS